MIAKKSFFLQGPYHRGYRIVMRLRLRIEFNQLLYKHVSLLPEKIHDLLFFDGNLFIQIFFTNITIKYSLSTIIIVISKKMHFVQIFFVFDSNHVATCLVNSSISSANQVFDEIILGQVIGKKLLTIG